MQKSIEPGDEFLDMKRFTKIVIGACFETINAFMPGVACSKNEYRN
jgi:hypothetical protein